MRREKARALKLLCLASDSAPENALKEEPRIAAMLTTYHLCQSLGTLPNPGGLRDQPADFVEFATVFVNAEVSYARSTNG